MNRSLACGVLAALVSAPCLAQSASEPALPYSPSLDVSSMDRSIDPCTDLYTYSCGGWQKKNPIPPDETSWSVYAKLYRENLAFLRGILTTAAAAKSGRDQVTQEIGDFFGACMDESAVNQRGVAAIQPQLDAIAALTSTRDIAPLVAHVTLPFGRTLLFGAGSTQDPDDSEKVIADLDQGGLGLPDRDYYTKEDAKSKEIRERYVQYVAKVFELLGDKPEAAAKNAAIVMGLETALAKASWTRVEQRNPYNLKNKMKMGELEKTGPRFRLVIVLSRLELSAVRNPERGVAQIL